MAKLTLQDVPSGFNSGPTISANNTLVEEAVEKTLSRDGTSPNDMEVDLDLGGHRIINLAAPVEDNDAVRKIDIEAGVEIIVSVPWDEVTDKPSPIEQVAALVDPGEDKLLFWDDSAGTLTYLTLGSGLEITDSTIVAEGGGGGGGVLNPDTYPDSPNAMDDEFEEGSLNARWTWRDQSTATANFAQSCLVLAGLPLSTAVHRAIEQTIVGTGRWRAKFSQQFHSSSIIGGLGLRRTANNNNIGIGCQGDGTTGRVTKWSGSSFNDNPGGFTPAHSTLFSYFEVEYDGTNVAFRWSPVGVDGSFLTAFTETAATFLDGAPDRVFFYINQQNQGTAPGTLVVDWFRKVA